MSNVDTSQLCHPELISELALCEVLENRCIDLPIFKSLNKEELVEIFKRIALPMPQRRYNESRHLGKKLNDLRATRGIENSISSEDTNLSSMNGLVPEVNSVMKSRLRPPVSDSQQASKKIRLSNMCQHESVTEDLKRKNEISSIMESKKRQKITWP